MRPAAVLLILALAGTPPAAADEDGWRALAAPGTAALVRHATAPGIGDPAGFRLGDCATQRNLDAAGRAQARAIGEAMRRRGIAVDRVLTSQWCRCRETAELLGLAPIAEIPALNSFFADRSRAEAQTRAVLALLRGRAAGEKLVLVTHQVNIVALTGISPASGEMVVVAMGADGRVAVKGRVGPGEGGER